MRKSRHEFSHFAHFLRVWVPTVQQAEHFEAFRLEASMADLPSGYYRIELNRTVWEVPEKYQDLSPIGTGAYGQVW